MPTNDLGLAVEALKALQATGANLALLRDPIDLRTEHHTSDVDAVVDAEPSFVLRQALPSLNTKGIHVAAVWPYDVGGTATVFLFNDTATRGAQLDLLYDPDGLGHYSVRSSALLIDVVQTSPLPTVEPNRLLIYEASKRHRKRQPGRLRQALDRLDELPEERVHSLVRQVAASPALAHLILKTDPGIRTPGRPRRVLTRARRLRDRIATPVGFWVHSANEELAATITERFAAVLVRTAACATPSAAARFPLWYARIVAPVRWRPGLVASWGSEPLWQPDLLLEAGSDVDAAVAEVVSAMERRLF